MPNNSIIMPPTGIILSDPLISKVKLLMDMQAPVGSTASNAIVDYMGNDITFAGVIGNTNPRRPGDTYAELNAANTGITSNVTGNPALDFSGDFCIEAWIWLIAYGQPAGSSTIFATIRGNRAGFAFHVGNNASSCRLTSNGTGGWADNLTVAANKGLQLATWTHMCLERWGDQMTIYNMGEVAATRTGAAALNLTQGIPGFMIGAYADTSAPFAPAMRLGAHRVTAAARYKGTFTPPQSFVY